MRRPYCNGGQPVILATPAVIGGVGYGGGGGLQICGTTSTSGTAIGEIIDALSNIGSSLAIGFTYWTSCPGSIGIDCAALGGIGYSGAGYYNFFHVNGFISATGLNAAPGPMIAQENAAGGTIVYNPVEANRVYRINLQTNNGSGNNWFKVCDIYNRLLYVTAMTANSVNDDQIHMMITGEESTTSGYSYRFGNYVANTNGTFSPYGPCF